MKHRGFTLVELVVVIVLLGIIGTISSRYIRLRTGKKKCKLLMPVNSPRECKSLRTSSHLEIIKNRRGIIIDNNSHY
jgi:prepilin-type N-terminal cleavage/methylation domain-containing protein